MIPHDLHNRLSFLRSNEPVTLTNLNTAQVGQIIDMVDLMSLEYVIAAGALTDAAMTLTPLVEHGDASNLSDAAAVDDVDLLGTEAAAIFTQADDNAVKTVGYVGTKRYVRLTLTPAGNDAGSATFGATAVGIKRFRGTGN
jgi:hypothetical protein